MLRNIAMITAMTVAITGCMGQKDAAEPDAKVDLKAPESHQPASHDNILPDDAVGKVNDHIILASDGMTNINEIISLEVTAQKARNGGLPEEELKNIRAEVDQVTRQMTAQAYAEYFMQSVKVSDNDIQNRYDDLISQQDSKEYKFTFAIFDSEKMAQEAIDGIKSGSGKVNEKFKPLQSADGQDMVWTQVSQLPPMFSSILPSLSKGSTNDKAFPSNQGYFVILLEDHRQKSFPTVEEVRDSIENTIRQETFSSLVKELRSNSIIQIK